MKLLLLVALCCTAASGRILARPGNSSVITKVEEVHEVHEVHDHHHEAHDNHHEAHDHHHEAHDNHHAAHDNHHETHDHHHEAHDNHHAAHDNHHETHDHHHEANGHHHKAHGNHNEAHSHHHASGCKFAAFSGLAFKKFDIRVTLKTNTASECLEWFKNNGDKYHAVEYSIKNKACYAVKEPVWTRTVVTPDSEIFVHKPKPDSTESYKIWYTTFIKNYKISHKKIIHHEEVEEVHTVDVELNKKIVSVIEKLPADQIEHIQNVVTIIRRKNLKPEQAAKEIYEIAKKNKKVTVSFEVWWKLIKGHVEKINEIVKVYTHKKIIKIPEPKDHKIEHTIVKPVVFNVNRTILNYTKIHELPAEYRIKTINRTIITHPKITNHTIQIINGSSWEEFDDSNTVFFHKNVTLPKIEEHQDPSSIIRVIKNQTKPVVKINGKPIEYTVKTFNRTIITHPKITNHTIKIVNGSSWEEFDAGKTVVYQNNVTIPKFVLNPEGHEFETNQFINNGEEVTYFKKFETKTMIFTSRPIIETKYETFESKPKVYKTEEKVIFGPTEVISGPIAVPASQNGGKGKN